MDHYLALTAPIAPAHRLGATRDDGDTVYIKIDAVLGSMVLGCGSSIDTREYEGRMQVVTALP